MDFKDRQREAMRLAARIESKAAEANSEAKSAGGKEWEANSEAKSAGGKEREPEFLFFYRCHTALIFSIYKDLSDCKQQHNVNNHSNINKKNNSNSDDTE